MKIKNIIDMKDENKKLGQNPAFPSEFTTGAKGEFGEPIISHRISYGMSKRFYAACQILPGIISGKGSAGLNELRDNYMEKSVELAFKYADELLKQENK